MTSSFAALLCALVASPLHAAEVTEIAPFLRGDLGLRYDMGFEHNKLMEGTDQVGSRKLAEHRLTYQGSFSFITGGALFFEVPHYLHQSLGFDEAYEMQFDPFKDTGSMVGTDEINDPPRELGKGLGGTWLGLRGVPLSEELYAARGDRVSWLFEFGYRFKDNTNYWS